MLALHAVKNSKVSQQKFFKNYLNLVGFSHYFVYAKSFILLKIFTMIPKFKYTFQYFTFNLINEGKSQYFMTITYVTTCRKPLECSATPIISISKRYKNSCKFCTKWKFFLLIKQHHQYQIHNYRADPLIFSNLWDAKTGHQYVV